MHNCCSNSCKEIARLPEEAQKELRRGKAPGRNIFKKGRAEHLVYKSNRVKPEKD
jgi:UPF0176 protein